jgi:hypothetical protein
MLDAAPRSRSADDSFSNYVRAQVVAASRSPRSCCRGYDSHSWSEIRMDDHMRLSVYPAATAAHLHPCSNAVMISSC